MITTISSLATSHVLGELATLYERDTGQSVKVETVGGVVVARRVESGEALDIVVLAADVIDRLAAAGHVRAGSRTDIVRSGVAIAVAAGAAHPGVDSESALRDAVMRARTVGYSTGPSGVYIMRLFERWGVAEALAPRLVQAPPGVPVGGLIAEGKVELGFQQMSELIHLPGIDILGMLPPQVQLITVFSAGICSASRNVAAAEAFLRFLASPATADAKRRHGMEPLE